jgi:hypothetical protein
MGEAPPAEAAPGAEGAAQKKRRLLRRVPTSVLLTLLGIGLSAWLLPAFTRQWDDRQKSHDLKVAIVADMASASARAVSGGQAIWAGQHVDKSQIADDWLSESLSIDARLRAYFNHGVTGGWEVYSWLLDRYVDADTSGSDPLLLSAETEAEFYMTPQARAATASILGMSSKLVAAPGGKPRFITGPDRAGYLEDLYYSLNDFGYPVKTYRPNGKRAPSDVEFALLNFLQELNREVLAAHVSGYSTTWNDLFHDLIP